MEMTKPVSWESYARKYDLLFQHNPFYQQIHRRVLRQVGQWDIHPGDRIADLGAGTGNYSLALARCFPQAEILHIDNNEGMNTRAFEKQNEAGISNLRVLPFGIEDLHLDPGSLRALVSIHALYTFSEPQKVLEKMYEWLEPGGQAILVDAGRVVRVLDWQIALGKHLIRTCGLRKTLSIFREGREVSRQNAFIRRMQRNGTFWTHSHEEFLEAVRNAGFGILEADRTFRGISDWVVAQKQPDDH